MELLTIDGVTINLSNLLYTEVILSRETVNGETSSCTNVLAYLDSRDGIKVIKLVSIPYKKIVASELMCKIMTLVEDDDGTVVIDKEELDDLIKDAVENVSGRVGVKKEYLMYSR